MWDALPQNQHTKHTHALTQISVRYFILAAPESFSERVASNRENQTLDRFQRVCFYLKDFEPLVQGVKMTLTFPFVAAAFCHVALLAFQNASDLEGKLDGQATQLGTNPLLPADLGEPVDETTAQRG